MAQQGEQGQARGGLVQLERILARLPGALLVVATDHRLKYAIGASLQTPNLTGDALTGRKIEDCLSACGFGAHAPVEPLLSALSGVPATYEAWFGSKWFEITSQPLFSRDGSVESVLVLALDATKRKLAQIDLRRRDAVLRLAAFEAPMLLQTRDEDLRLTFLTGALVRELQFDASAAMGTKFEVVPGTGEGHPIITAHQFALQGRRSDAVQFELRNRLIEARVEPLREEDGTISGTVSVWFDVTEQRRTTLLANHDVLTGLPNRTLLRELLGQGLALSKEHRSAAAVAALDIDDFKRINDTLGIDAGDRVLAAVAQRIRQVLRPSDSAARSSGNEFIIVRPDLDDVNATQLTRALLDAFKQPFQVDHRDLFVNASIGVSVYPSDGEDVEQLLARADAALIAAKARTRGGVQFFRSSLHAAAIERLSLEGELRRALDREEFVLHYQPIIDVRTKKLVGTEALIRWQHPQRGLILPGHFIPACEQNGLIVPLGSWVLRTACAQWASWFPRGGPQFVSVNVSPRQLEHDILGDVRKVLAQIEIPPESIELEFTENALIKDQEPGIEAIAKLQNLGVRISIDDFGTGYSSLAYLKQLPVNTLKIDRLFVRDIATSPYDAAIARTIIALAQSIDLRVIAEGVETVEQLDLLAALDCELMQGYLFGRPVPADELLSAGAGA